MHQLYETSAFVLKSVPYGEADTVVTLLTQDFGVVRATAKGIRYEKSKLRFAVQPHAHIVATLVQGKEMWRLANAQTGVDFLDTDHEMQFEIQTRLFRLLDRLVSGEEPDTHLFSLVESGLQFLGTQQDALRCEQTEQLLVLRVLHQLGYVADHAHTAVLLHDTDWNTELLDHLAKEKQGILIVINKAIQESQL